MGAALVVTLVTGVDYVIRAARMGKPSPDDSPQSAQSGPAQSGPAQTERSKRGG